MNIQAVGSARALLDLQNVSKAYRLESRDFLAIRDINLQIQSGELVCLLGPHGCGKSTLLRIVAGRSAASSGVVYYRGHPLKADSSNLTIGLPTFELSAWLTVQQNIETAFKACGVPASVRANLARQLIAIVGLAGFETAYPRELSGHMRQKVGLARAVAVEPDLLCLDEPFAALDMLSAEALRREVLGLWLENRIATKAILLASRSAEEAVLIADRIVIMGDDPGHIVSEITITLRHPRQRKHRAFQDLVDRVSAAVAGQAKQKGEALGNQPGQPGTTRALPQVRLDAVPYLLEKLVKEGARVDLSRMGCDLTVALDDLLAIVEAADLLGFVTIDEGDVRVTPLGRAYANSSARARKAIVAGRVLRLPLMAWIYETLQRDANRRVTWSYFQENLTADFGDLAAKQLAIAIAWGRQTELFSHNDKTGDLYIDGNATEVTEKTFALAELYETWPSLATRERVEGFKLLQEDQAVEFFLHLSTRGKAQLILALPTGPRKLSMWLLANTAAAKLTPKTTRTEHD